MAGLWLVRRLLGLGFSFAILLRCGPAGVAMAAAVWPVRDAPLWLTVPLGAAVYLLVLALTGTFRRARLAALDAP